jgi:hypothetical protein
MEIFPYIIDVVFFAFAIYWSASNLVREPGEPTFGLFRYHERIEKADPKAPKYDFRATPKPPPQPARRR